MQLEVNMKGKASQFFPLDQEKILVGSSSSADILIDHPEISRKHLAIHREGEKFFVSDQGSTNGTYINDERLTPGAKSEFTSFFPIRLGNDVILTLILNDDSTGTRSTSTFLDKGQLKSTGQVHAGSITTPSTAKYGAKAGGAKSSLKPLKGKKKRPSSLLKQVLAILFVLVGMFLVYKNFFTDEKDLVEEQADPQEPTAVVPKESLFDQTLTLPTYLTQREIKQLSELTKCKQEIEERICLKLKLVAPNQGAVLKDRELIVFMNRPDRQRMGEFFTEKKLIDDPSNFERLGLRQDFDIDLFYLSAQFLALDFSDSVDNLYVVLSDPSNPLKVETRFSTMKAFKENINPETYSRAFNGFSTTSHFGVDQFIGVWKSIKD